MRKGKTRRGFEYSYDEKILSNMRFLEKVVATEQDGLNGISALISVADMLLGSEQKEKLYEFLEENSPDHEPTVEETRNEIVDIINGAGSEGKN